MTNETNGKPNGKPKVFFKGADGKVTEHAYSPDKILVRLPNGKIGEFNTILTIQDQRDSNGKLNSDVINIKMHGGSPQMLFSDVPGMMVEPGPGVNPEDYQTLQQATKVQLEGLAKTDIIVYFAPNAFSESPNQTEHQKKEKAIAVANKVYSRRLKKLENERSNQLSQIGILKDRVKELQTPQTVSQTHVTTIEGSNASQKQLKEALEQAIKNYNILEEEHLKLENSTNSQISDLETLLGDSVPRAEASRMAENVKNQYNTAARRGANMTPKLFYEDGTRRVYKSGFTSLNAAEQELGGLVEGQTVAFIVENGVRKIVIGKLFYNNEKDHLVFGCEEILDDPSKIQGSNVSEELTETEFKEYLMTQMPGKLKDHILEVMKIEHEKEIIERKQKEWKKKKEENPDLDEPGVPDFDNPFNPGGVFLHQFKGQKLRLFSIDDAVEYVKLHSNDLAISYGTAQENEIPSRSVSVKGETTFEIPASETLKSKQVVTSGIEAPKQKTSDELAYRTFLLIRQYADLQGLKSEMDNHGNFRIFPSANEKEREDISELYRAKQKYKTIFDHAFALAPTALDKLLAAPDLDEVVNRAVAGKQTRKDEAKYDGALYIVAIAKQQGFLDTLIKYGKEITAFVCDPKKVDEFQKKYDQEHPQAIKKTTK